MSVNVSKIKYVPPPPIQDLTFRWKCTQCEEENESTVIESTLLQYKLRNFGPMKVERACHKCDAVHSMELRL